MSILKPVHLMRRPVKQSIFASILIGLGFVLVTCSTNRPSAVHNRDIIWEDNFEGIAGQPPDSSKWSHDIGTGWGNQQKEYDTDKLANASLDGEGNLAIVAIKESYEDQDYTSARLVTRGKMEFSYGKYEARIKLPIGAGIWPAFWLLGANISEVGWPLCGEIDIMEYRGHEPAINHGTVHGPGYSGSQGKGRKYKLPNTHFDTDFHRFSVEWLPDRITWYVDDTQYNSISPSDLPGDWVFDHPFYMILNIAVGGTWGGAVDNETIFPQTMLVDYVRVYQINEKK